MSSATKIQRGLNNWNMVWGSSLPLLNKGKWGIILRMMLTPALLA